MREATSMGTPTITNPVDTAALREVADECNPDSEAYALTHQAADEIERLRGLLDGPCGSCHPCMNWSAEVLRAAIGEHRSDTMRPGGNPFGATPADERLWAALDR